MENNFSQCNNKKKSVAFMQEQEKERERDQAQARNNFFIVRAKAKKKL